MKIESNTEGIYERTKDCDSVVDFHPWCKLCGRKTIEWGSYVGFCAWAVSIRSDDNRRMLDSWGEVAKLFIKDGLK